MPELADWVEGVPRDPAILVSFDNVDPFFGDPDALAEGVEVVSSQETLPSLADKSQLPVLSAGNTDQTCNGKVIREARK